VLFTSCLLQTTVSVVITVNILRLHIGVTIKVPGMIVSCGVQRYRGLSPVSVF